MWKFGQKRRAVSERNDEAKITYLKVERERENETTRPHQEEEEQRRTTQRNYLNS